MSLASSVTDLATRIASYLKTSVLPRLLPAGGAAGLVLAKSAAADYSVSWVQGWTSANFDPGTKANVSGQAFTGAISAPSITTTSTFYLPGQGNNWFVTGGGYDGATYSGGNVNLRLHWGLGMQTYDGTVNGFYDSRAGRWDTKGVPRVNGQDVWYPGNFDPSTKANVSGGNFGGNLGIFKTNDAIFTLEDLGAPETSFRRKQIFSSANVGGGSDWLFRQTRPSDGAIQDFILPGGYGGTIWTSGNFNPGDKPNLGTFNLFTGKNRIPLDGMGVNDISKEIAGGTWWTGGATKAQGWPVDTSYMHLFSSNYSNSAGEYYALQLASHFFQNDDFYIRSTGSAGLQPWRTLLHDGLLTNLEYSGQSFVMKIPGGLLLQGASSIITLDAEGRARIPLITAGVTACVALVINGDTNVNGNPAGAWTGSNDSFGVKFQNSPNATVRINWIAFSRWKQ